MGIRGILGILLGGLGSIVQLIPPGKRSFVVSRMYIDVIQFVHKALNELDAEASMQDRTGPIDEYRIAQVTVELIMQYVKEIAPRDFLGIYFDGIPPMAKVVEQRARRYEMELSAKSFNKAKITVGTSFLRTIVDAVINGLAANASILPRDVELSTPAEKGEGEHKLANRIRDRDSTEPGTKVIVADDGDVIIMALLNAWKDCYVYIDHKNQKNPRLSRHGLVSIPTVAERIKARLGDTPTAITDFCLMVILTGGNDFMPTILSARQRTSILTELMDLYGPILKGQPLMTGVGREINWVSVRLLVNELSKNEERNLRELMDLIKKKTGRIPRLFTRSLDPHTGVFKLSFFKKAWDQELYEVKKDLPDGIIIPTPVQREIDADHNISALQYLQGLSWTLTYMRTGDGPDWFYSHPYPPLFGDLARVMAVVPDPARSLRTMPLWKPLPLADYLLVVLPRGTTEDLFGQTFVNAFARGAGIADLFPKKFNHFTPAEWDETFKGRAILPPLFLERIRKVVEDRLDVTVIERNLLAIDPRLRFSKSSGEWVTVSGQPKRGTSEGEKKDYEILESVIPALS